MKMRLLLFFLIFVGQCRILYSIDFTPEIKVMTAEDIEDGSNVKLCVFKDAEKK